MLHVLHKLTASRCCLCLFALCCVCASATVPVWVKRRLAKAADTQDRYLSGIRPVRLMAICSESVHPLASMECLEENLKLQVQQKSIQLSRTIQPFPLRGVLAPNLCLLTLLHSSPSDSALSFHASFSCHVLLMAAVLYMTTGKSTVTQQSYYSCLGRAAICGVGSTRTFTVRCKGVSSSQADGLPFSKTHLNKISHLGQ